MYIVVSQRNHLLADVQTGRPALTASGPEVADMLVGRLFHCLSVPGKKEWRGLGGFIVSYYV